MSISQINDLCHYNNNFYYAAYNKNNDWQPHVIKQNSDNSLIDLGVPDVDAWNSWQFLNSSLGLFVYNSPDNDPSKLYKIESDLFIYTGDAPWTFSSFKETPFKKIKEIDGELWALHSEDTKVVVYNGISWREEGGMNYSDFAYSFNDLFYINNSIYLIGQGLYKYNSTYSYAPDENTKWEILIATLSLAVIDNSYIDCVVFNDIVFISGTSKIGILNINSYNITISSSTIPNAKFLIINNHLYCYSSDLKIYKYDILSSTWINTGIPGNGHIRFINNTLYSAGRDGNVVKILQCN